VARAAPDATSGLGRNMENRGPASIKAPSRGDSTSVVVVPAGQASKSATLEHGFLYELIVRGGGPSPLQIREAMAVPKVACLEIVQRRGQELLAIVPRQQPQGFREVLGVRLK